MEAKKAENRISEIDDSEIKLAYKKLKSYVYHENFSLNLRVELAKYETADIDGKLAELKAQINRYALGEKKDLQSYLSKIDVQLMPKAFKPFKNEQSNESAFYFSNANKRAEYIVESITPFIVCPIEMHIACILWIMKIGQYLDAELDSSCYGNRLMRNTDDIFEDKSIKLFQKYYEKYNLWRDNAIVKAKALHKLKLNSVIINLDLKNYYNSVDFDLTSLDSAKWDGFKWLNELLVEIHTSYIQRLEKAGFDLSNKKILPIGLITSGLLANYYLRDFDAVIKDRLSPEFYGRYVDDILIVKSNPVIPDNQGDKVDEFLKSYLANLEVWKDNSYGVSVCKKEEGSKTYYIKIKDNELMFQLKKVKLYHFLADESVDLLNEFEKEIKKNSSEFKFQPESQDVFDSFENVSYKISYSDTINKIRSIDGFDVDKFGASKHLVKLINISRSAEKLSKKDLDELNERVTTYFSGQRSLELSALWEKVFTFYMVNSNSAKDKLISFAKEQIKNIFRIEYRPSENSFGHNLNNAKEEIEKSLFTHLGNCFSMAASLNLDFFTNSIINHVKDNNFSNEETEKLQTLSSKTVIENAKNLVNANLFRHNYQSYPLLNYCKQDDKFNFVSKSIDINTTKFEIDLSKVKYSPRFIHYHELCLFFNYRKWFTSATDEQFEKNQSTFIYDKYCEFNSISEELAKKNRSYYPAEDEKKVGVIKSISLGQKKLKEKLRIGIVNTPIDVKNSLEAFSGKPQLSFERVDEINKVLNSCIHKNSGEKCDIIIFPEISIPYQWLPILTNFAKRNQVAIVCGTEHIVNSSREVLNLATTVLPFVHNTYNNALVDFRLKIDYSPEEAEQIKGHFLKVPSERAQLEKMRLYIWNKVHFSVFNCFELTDISKRSTFRGEVDLIVTVEHNQDVNYFSNITESVARDIHSYVVQVNSSKFGDSRITRPSETYSKDIVKIKGGENVLAVVDTIDLKKLRDFQILDYNLQKLNRSFKPTPPNFIMADSRKK